MNWLFSLTSLVVILGTIVAWFCLIAGWNHAVLVSLLVAFTAYVIATIVLNQVRQ